MKMKYFGIYQAGFNFLAIFFSICLQFVAIDAHSDLFCIFCAHNFAISSEASVDHHKQGLDLWSCIKIGNSQWATVTYFNLKVHKSDKSLWSQPKGSGAMEPNKVPQSLGLLLGSRVVTCLLTILPWSIIIIYHATNTSFDCFENLLQYLSCKNGFEYITIIAVKLLKYGILTQ